MPIHLPPLTRRRFLLRSIAATSVLSLRPQLLAESKTTNENSWVLFSDIHLSADRSQVVRGVNMADHFKAASGEVLALPENPKGVFINGDCAMDTGEIGDYATVAQMLKPLREAGLPIHLGLGNHDNRERFWASFEEEKAAKRPLVDRQASLFQTPNVNWFMLDSLEITRSTPGLLGPEQLKWLASSLDENASKPAVVMVHHNYGLSGNMGLKDTAAFFEVIRPRKQVKAYIYGHTHTWRTDKDESGIHLINLPPVAYVFQEGQPAGWVHAQVEKTGMKMELRCLDTSHKSHGQNVNFSWRT